ATASRSTCLVTKSLLSRTLTSLGVYVARNRGYAVSVRRAPTATAIVAPPATPTSSTSPSQLRKLALRSARVRTQMASTLRSFFALSSPPADLVGAGLARVPLPEAGLRSSPPAVGDQHGHHFLHAPIVLRARC